MKSNKILSLLVLFSCIIVVISTQYPGYANSGQHAYPNIPTEIVDLPTIVDHRPRVPVNNIPFQTPYKWNNYGLYPYPYFGPYGVHRYPPFTRQNLQNPRQLPKSLFRNPTPEFPNGYYVIPGSQREIEVTPEEQNEQKGTPSNGTVQSFPGYVIKQTTHRHQSPNQAPIKITSSTVEYKPFHTVLTRYIDRNGKPVIKLENENGTLTLDGKGSTSLNINNGKLEINGVDPSQVTTTTEAEEVVTEVEDVTPNDISAWIG